MKKPRVWVLLTASFLWGCTSSEAPPPEPDNVTPVYSLDALSGVSMESADAAVMPGGKCGKCGCQAGHCGAGVPGHLACKGDDPRKREVEKQAYEKRKETAETAIKEGFDKVSTTTACNVVVHSIAKRYGYDGFTMGKDSKGNDVPMKAHEMWEHFLGPPLPKTDADAKRCVAAVKARAEEGWVILSSSSTEKSPKLLSLAETIQYANAGNLALKVAHRDTLIECWKALPKRPGTEDRYSPNDPKMRTIKKPEHGHALVIKGGQKATDSRRDVSVINASLGDKQASFDVRLSSVVALWQEPAFCYFVYTKPPK